MTRSLIELSWTAKYVNLPNLPNFFGAQFAGAQFAETQFAGTQFADKSVRGPICRDPNENINYLQMGIHSTRFCTVQYSIFVGKVYVKLMTTFFSVH